VVALPRELEATRASDADLTIRLRPFRRDALPEYTHYVDSGCDIHPSCLTCPLERCRYDAVGGARAIRGEERDRRIVASWRAGGRTVGALASEFQVSRRTVFRVLSRARQQTRPMEGETNR
jgi:hypothetical protein